MVWGPRMSSESDCSSRPTEPLSGPRRAADLPPFFVSGIPSLKSNIGSGLVFGGQVMLWGDRTPSVSGRAASGKLGPPNAGQRSTSPLPGKQLGLGLKRKGLREMPSPPQRKMCPGAGNGAGTRDLGEDDPERGARPSNAWSGGRDSNPRHPAELGADGHSHLPEVLAADEHSRVGASAYLL
jgi:hypothetical protein